MYIHGRRRSSTVMNIDPRYYPPPLPLHHRKVDEMKSLAKTHLCYVSMQLDLS